LLSKRRRAFVLRKVLIGIAVKADARFPVACIDVTSFSSSTTMLIYTSMVHEDSISTWDSQVTSV
jgi:hypothetical protein